MSILNLTQHPATPAQTAEGVVDLPAEDRKTVQQLLTFEQLPSQELLRQRAEQVADIAGNYAGVGEEAMIGGAPFFDAYLREELIRIGIRPVYAFSARAAEEVVLPDGSVRKTQVFRHMGFVR